MSEWLAEIWCELFHRGGDIKRDSEGRINWQCAKCGRWGTSVTDLEEDELLSQYLADKERKK